MKTCVSELRFVKRSRTFKFFNEPYFFGGDKDLVYVRKSTPVIKLAEIADFVCVFIPTLNMIKFAGIQFWMFCTTSLEEEEEWREKLLGCRNNL